MEFSRIVGSCIRSTALHLAALPVLLTTLTCDSPSAPLESCSRCRTVFVGASFDPQSVIMQVAVVSCVGSVLVFVAIILYFRCAS